MRSPCAHLARRAAAAGRLRSTAADRPARRRAVHERHDRALVGRHGLHGCAARDYRAELVAGQMFNLPRVAVKGAGRGVFSATFRCAARPALRQRAGTPRRGCCHACPRCMHVRGERTL